MADRDEWMSRGTCHNRPALLPAFFNDADPSMAQRICGRCEVREPCLEYAMADATLVGVSGGTTDKERRQLRKQRRAA